MKTQRASKTVFRNSLITGSVIGGNLILVPLAIAGLAHPGSGNVIGAVVFSVVLWVIWLMGWWSKVTVTGGGVTVDNVCYRHFIPWDDLADIGYEGGLSFKLKDGAEYGTFGYGGSLAGAINGYRRMQRVRDDMLAARTRLAVDPAGDGEPGHQLRGRVVIAWWPVLIYLALFESAALIAVTHH
ncbi:MAG TPA: PH domain-containing protein [Streptosporangiaceae bacterium]